MYFQKLKILFAPRRSPWKLYISHPRIALATVIPVISREHFRKTNYSSNTYLVSEKPICKIVSQILALKRAIGISNTNCHLRYQF
jgi:hypothetical protein